MSNVNLESLNFPGHFIRHAAFLAELTRRGGPVNDFAFTLISRGAGQIALRSVNFRDRFLRHRDFRIHLEGPAGARDDLWRQDSTFFFEEGLADRTGVSFRSLNFPDRYLRHRDFHLVLDAPSGPGDESFRRDATFFRRPAAVLIDHGTELDPV
ncbi:MAG TPA: AbfB domain-containing protein [Microlunatus sp.]